MSYSVSFETFITLYNAIYEVEEPKIALCNLIPSWDLDAHLGSLSVPVRLPRDPFEASPQYFQAQLTAVELRDLFVTSVWKTDLEPAIKRGLRRASDAYEGSAITVVLLSGGSCKYSMASEAPEKGLRFRT